MFEPAEKVLYIIQFLVDLLVAYIAHHFGPRLPGPSHVREYVDPLVIVCFAFPLQFVVYHSYSAARPWYVLALLVMILVMCAAAWLCYRLYSSTSPSVVKPGERVPRHSRALRQWAWRLLWSLAATYVLFAGLWIFWQLRPSEKATIIVARLAGPSPEYSLTNEVIADLRTAAEPSDNIEILPARISVTAEEGSEVASSLGKPLIGKRHEATMVVWGWWEESPTSANIVANLEPIHVGELLSRVTARSEYNVPAGLSIATHAPFVIPIEQLRQFTFHPHFGHEIRLRSFYILGIAQLLTRDFAAAKNYFNKSYDETARELFPQVLVSRGFTEIGLAREHFRVGDEDEAKQLLLDAQSDCEKAVSLQEPAGHSCLGQISLERGQFKLALLTLTYQQSQPTWNNRIVEEGAVMDVNTAIQESSRAIELLPKSTAPYGCRAHGNFLLGSREAGFRPEHPASTRSEMYYRRAIEDWSHVITANQRDFDALLRRGNVFLMLDDYQEADSDFTESIKLDRSYFGTFFWRGIARGKMNRLEAAASDFKTATDLAHDFAPAWCALGRSRRLSGQRYLAREALLRCQQLSGQGTLLWEEADDQLKVLQ